MRKAALFVCAVLATMLLSVSAQAHTETELYEWKLDWQERVEARGGTLTTKLVAEYVDWHQRHPCSEVLATACPIPEVTHAAPSQARPSGNTGMGSGNVEQWRGLVEGYFGSYTDEALRVIACESGGNPNAYNPSGASGLFQVMPSWQRKFGGDLFDPANNVRIAKILFDDGASRGWRWSHWVCQP